MNEIENYTPSQEASDAFDSYLLLRNKAALLRLIAEVYKDGVTKRNES